MARAVPAVPHQPGTCRGARDGRASRGACLSGVSHRGACSGDRYQIRELLGRGGMGEVWRAFDLKLRVDVALKAIRPERARGRAAPRAAAARGALRPRGRFPERLPHLRPRSRTTARSCVSMEYVDGDDARRDAAAAGPARASGGAGDRVAVPGRSRGDPPRRPRAPRLQARERDADPRRARGGDGLRARQGRERRAGRRRSRARRPTWRPSRRAGRSLDARADVFAAGVVLAEMLLGRGSRRSRGTPGAVAGGARDAAAGVPRARGRAVLRQGLSPISPERPASAQALARALEEVTLRLPGFEQKRAVPGARELHRERRGVLLRARAGGGGDLARS